MLVLRYRRYRALVLWRIAECKVGQECSSVNPVLPANSGRSSDWYKSSVYYDFVKDTQICSNFGNFDISSPLSPNLT